MREFRLRNDLQRVVLNDFAFPLGLAPAEIPAPRQGYTLAYHPGEDEEPDTYIFSITVSHENLAALLQRAMKLLPAVVTPIIEIGSRDAYRSLDVYLGREIDSDEFTSVVKEFEPFLLEDASIGIGANAEEPFLEIFLDSWKTLAIHAPLDMRDRVEAMLSESGLAEVSETWPDIDHRAVSSCQLREVLELEDEHSPDVDELLLQLRQLWDMELNVDPETNVDDSGRNLGLTLWHTLIIAESVDSDTASGAYISIWATAGSLTEMQTLIDQALDQKPQWELNEIYSIDRVAYDDRPDSLIELEPRAKRSKIHLVDIDVWGDGPFPPEPTRDEATRD